MRIGKEGVRIVELNPNPYIQKWCEDKVCRINWAKPTNYRGRYVSRSYGYCFGYSIRLSKDVDLESSEDECTEFRITIVKLCMTLFFIALQ